MNLTELACRHRVLLADYWADWCGPCKRLAPVLDSLVVETPELTVVKVNIDEHPDLAHNLAIMSVPTLVLYVVGELVAQRTAFAPAGAALLGLVAHVAALSKWKVLVEAGCAPGLHRISGQ